MAARVSTPQTLACKQSKGFAPRLVAISVDTTSSDEEQGTIQNDTGALQASSIVAYCFTHVLTLSTSSTQGHAEDFNAGVATVACAADVSAK